MVGLQTTAHPVGSDYAVGNLARSEALLRTRGNLDVG